MRINADKTHGLTGHENHENKGSRLVWSIWIKYDRILMFFLLQAYKYTNPSRYWYLAFQKLKMWPGKKINLALPFYVIISE